MTEPTDADRQRARELLAPFIWLERVGPMEVREFRAVADNIAAAIAATRTEGRREHAELAARLRDRAASMEDSDGMSSDTSKLLYEAATALGEPPDAT